MIDLLSPVGDFDCLKAAVQNGANSVYFGADLFSARAFASNFNLDELKEAIIYAKTRGVKTNLTLNTLVKNDEFKEAFELAKRAYQFGIDAIIVQDLGLAKLLIKSFPDLDIHASTQMSIHNLQGVLELQKLGFKRVVLSRELSISEIEYICKNSDVEIECFVHGALCISYSGQCLFSSMIGGRSGNRGKCAQPCRLPYELFENNTSIDKGYLLSTRDLCGLDYIPLLVRAGVTCLKIEGRMKSPEYVATVTKIYRKYIDMAENSDTFKIDEADRKILLQVFNRGMSSCGHLSDEPNKELVYKDKPNNMGLFLGIVEKYNSTKGYINIKLKEQIQIGDTISLENETGTYNVSELMIGSKNIKNTEVGQTVTLGRMKGNIRCGDKVFKMSSKNLILNARESFKNENRKIALNCKVTVKYNIPLEIQITSANNLEFYKDLSVSCKIDVLPERAENRPLTVDKIFAQINKTNSTPFEFNSIDIDLEDGLFLPKISSLNELRRVALEAVQKFVVNKVQKLSNINFEESNLALDINCSSQMSKSEKNTQISILLNTLNENFDYSKLENADNIYIPLKYFANKKYLKCLASLNKKFNIYIYLPTIIKSNYRNLLSSNIENAIKNYNIRGFVLSNISNLLLLENLFADLKDIDRGNFDFIANYTLNVFNKYSINELKTLGINSFTMSPELDKKSISKLSAFDNCNLKSELIVYGKTPLMNMNYCLLGKSNKCYPTCSTKCDKLTCGNSKYYIKDRLGFKFDIIPDNIQTITTIYNSKITSIAPNDLETSNICNLRIDILFENVDEINNIINTVKSGHRFEGKDFTNGNLNREI